MVQVVTSMIQDQAKLDVMAVLMMQYNAVEQSLLQIVRNISSGVVVQLSS